MAPGQLASMSELCLANKAAPEFGMPTKLVQIPIGHATQVVRGWCPGPQHHNQMLYVVPRSSLRPSGLIPSNQGKLAHVNSTYD